MRNMVEWINYEECQPEVSGEYLITFIDHRFNDKRFINIAELSIVEDSWGDPIGIWYFDDEFNEKHKDRLEVIAWANVEPYEG